MKIIAIFSLYLLSVLTLLCAGQIASTLTCRYATTDQKVMLTASYVLLLAVICFGGFCIWESVGGIA